MVRAIREREGVTMSNCNLGAKGLLHGHDDWYPSDFTYEDGAWVGPRVPVSYPDDGHEFLPEDLHNWWYGHRAKIILDSAEKHARGPRVLWDIGGGTGLMAVAFANAGWKTALVEPVESAARQAVGTADAIFAGQLEDLALPSASVPAIGLFDVIEHLDDPVTTLQECRRVLMPGGIIIVTVPALPRLWSTTDAAVGHKRRYTKAQIGTEARAAGLRCLQQRYFFALLAIAALPTRIVPSKKRSAESEAAILARERHFLNPSPWINRLLRGIMASERLIGGLVPFPGGLSLLAVLTHEQGASTTPGRSGYRRHDPE